MRADDRKTRQTPILFWPLPNIFTGGEFTEGRNTFYWKERISTTCGRYFGSYDKFLGAACELEFLLELNSYFGTNVIGDPSITEWQKINCDNVFFDYNPDLFAYDLLWTVPMAERVYDLIASDQPFPSHLAVMTALFDIAFKDKDTHQRLLIFGGFLNHLGVWQDKMMYRTSRWPFVYGWEGRLGDIVEQYRKQPPNKS